MRGIVSWNVSPPTKCLKKVFRTTKRAICFTIGMDVEMDKRVGEASTKEGNDKAE
jgi:hypothetical protein